MGIGDRQGRVQNAAFAGPMNMHSHGPSALEHTDISMYEDSESYEITAENLGALCCNVIKSMLVLLLKV